jgi:tetratricopeptide (TPR) repeat protein
VVAAQLGYAYALDGRVAEGIVSLSEAVDSFVTVRSAMNHALSVAWLGEALLLAGRAEEAAAQATTALDLARQRGERGAEAWALRLHGELAACAEHVAPVRAERSYRAALDLAEALGMRPLQAHCHLGLGKLCLRMGRPDRARAAFGTAASLFSKLGIRRWLAEAEAELALLT